MARPIEIENEAPVTAIQAEEARDSRFRSVLREFLRDARWWFGVVLLLFTLAAIFAPQVSPYDPLTYHPSIVEQPPSWSHLLGTDSLGRDQLSRVIYGARISLSIGVISILMGGLAGVILGMLAAYFKGWVDQLVITITDALLAFPSLILALAILAALGPSLVNVAVSLAVVRIPIYARLARGQTLQVAAQDYVAAAHCTGTKTARILRRHILPNIFSPILVQATLSIPFALNGQQPAPTP